MVGHCYHRVNCRTQDGKNCNPKTAGAILNAAPSRTHDICAGAPEIAAAGFTIRASLDRYTASARYAVLGVGLAMLAIADTGFAAV
jgi:hypothetical protein